MVRCKPSRRSVDGAQPSTSRARVMSGRRRTGSPSRPAGIGTVVMGESANFCGGHEWLREHGVEVVDLADPECIAMLGDWIAANPAVWNEDIGED